MASAVALPVQAEGFYISGELGMNFGESRDVDGSDNDQPSVCGEYINPDFGSLTGAGEGSDCN